MEHRFQRANFTYLLQLRKWFLQSKDVCFDHNFLALFFQLFWIIFAFKNRRLQLLHNFASILARHGLALPRNVKEFEIH